MNRRTSIGQAQLLRFVVAVSLVCCVAIASFAAAPQASAAYGAPNSAQSGQESFAQSRCWDPSARIFGAIWSYPESITVMRGQPATINLFGSAFACPGAITGRDIWARGIHNVSAGSPLSFNYGTDLRRGIAYGQNDFTRSNASVPGSVGGPLKVDIDVSKLSNGKNCFTINRTYWDNVGGYGGPGDETICINVTIQSSWRLSMSDLYIKQLNPASGAPLPGAAGASKGTGVSVPNAIPGQRFGFYYKWVNVGPDPTTVTTSLRRVYTYPTASGNQTFFNHAPGISGGGGWMYSESNGSVGNTSVIPQSAIGKSYCMRTDAYPGESGSTAWKIGGQLCVNVVRSFSLVPTVTVPVQSVAPGTVTIPTISPKVTNGGSTDSYPNTYWKMVRFVVPPGGTAKPTSTGGTASPCVYYGNGCTDTFASPNNDGNRTFGRPVTNLTAVGDTVANLVPGAKVCYALSVKGYDAAHNPATANEWRYGAPTCVKVSQKPNIQVWGGDVRSRGKIATSLVKFGAGKFGSWVEYGAMSTGLNMNFASGSGLSEGLVADAAQRNQLTFANRGGTYGQYAAPATPGLIAQFKAMTPFNSGVGSSNLSGYASGIYKTTSSLSISKSAIGQAAGVGKSIIIITTGTVTITDDITYTGPGPGNSFTNIKQIPQLIIVAKNINIKGNVGEVNAWLLADTGGFINTCSDVTPTASLSNAICNKPLVINGPAVTDTLYLRRTAGASSAATANDPAEVFNLRADAYLWGYGNATQGGRVQTDQTTEAPPRF